MPREPTPHAAPGRQFVQLYVGVLAGDGLCLEEYRTALINLPRAL